VVIGPSSGTMHYASFCDAKMVGWGDKRKYTWRQNIRDRYEDIINPFGNPVTVLDDWEWNPPVEEILNAIANYV